MLIQCRTVVFNAGSHRGAVIDMERRAKCERERRKANAADRECIVDNGCGVREESETPGYHLITAVFRARRTSGQALSHSLLIGRRTGSTKPASSAPELAPESA